MNNTEDKQPDWTAIELDYRMGEDVDVVAGMYGVSSADICAMAAIEDWGVNSTFTEYFKLHRFRTFVDAYLTDLNPKKACITAGYPASASNSLFKKPEVRAMMERRLKEIEARSGITPDRIINEYGKIAFADPAKLVDEDGAHLPLHKIDPDTRAALASLETVEGANTLVTRKYKLSDKKGALDSLAKVFSMFTEKLEVKAEVESLGTVDDKDAARRIAFILARAMDQKT